MYDFFLRIRLTKVSRRSRGVPMLLLLFVSLPAALSSISQPHIYKSPVLRPVFDVVSIQSYGGAFALASLLIVWFLISRLYVAYILANIAMLFMSVLMHLLYLYASIVAGLPVSIVSYGTWSMVMGSCLYNLLTTIIVYVKHDLLTSFTEHTIASLELKEEISQEHEAVKSNEGSPTQ